ncbi:MAG TPA: hypothetical protein VN316_02165 [candidate division Zixibacteria bacterium]|nr:hypothetical protein [candidate division Zixibacteria bacterium]
MIVIEPLDVVKLLQTVLVPVLALSGLGLFILVVQTRYGSIINRIRVLNSSTDVLPPAPGAPKESISDLFRTQTIPPKPQEPPKAAEKK